MAIHPVIAKVVILIVTRFSSLLLIMVTSDPLVVTDFVLEIFGTDLDTFTLAGTEVPTF